MSTENKGSEQHEFIECGRFECQDMPRHCALVWCGELPGHTSHFQATNRPQEGAGVSGEPLYVNTNPHYWQDDRCGNCGKHRTKKAEKESCPAFDPPKAAPQPSAPEPQPVGDEQDWEQAKRRVLAVHSKAQHERCLMGGDVILIYGLEADKLATTIGEGLDEPEAWLSAAQHPSVASQPVFGALDGEKCGKVYKGNMPGRYDSVCVLPAGHGEVHCTEPDGQSGFLWAERKAHPQPAGIDMEQAAPLEGQEKPREYRKTAMIAAIQFTEQMALGKVSLPEGVVFGSRSTFSDGSLKSHRHIIETLEGRMDVQIGDWVATGVKGEHWPIKPGVFAASYEEVLPTPTPAPESVEQPAGIETCEHCGADAVTKGIDGTKLCRVCQRQLRKEAGGLVSPHPAPGESTNLRTSEDLLAIIDDDCERQQKREKSTICSVMYSAKVIRDLVADHRQLRAALESQKPSTPSAEGGSGEPETYYVNIYQESGMGKGELRAGFAWRHRRSAEESQELHRVHLGIAEVKIVRAKPSTPSPQGPTVTIHNTLCLRCNTFHGDRPCASPQEGGTEPTEGWKALALSQAAELKAKDERFEAMEAAHVKAYAELKAHKAPSGAEGQDGGLLPLLDKQCLLELQGLRKDGRDELERTRSILHCRERQLRFARQPQEAQKNVERGDHLEGDCLLCHKPVEPLAGNPSKWGVQLSISDRTGVLELFHYGCIQPLLDAALSQATEGASE